MICSTIKCHRPDKPLCRCFTLFYDNSIRQAERNRSYANWHLTPTLVTFDTSHADLIVRRSKAQTSRIELTSWKRGERAAAVCPWIDQARQREEIVAWHFRVGSLDHIDLPAGWSRRRWPAFRDRRAKISTVPRATQQIDFLRHERPVIATVRLWLRRWHCCEHW